MSWLAEHCPRLARAQADAIRFAQMRREMDRNRTAALLEWQRLEAHRELQLIRAEATNDPRYIKRRTDKLDQARAMVARLSEPVVMR